MTKAIMLLLCVDNEQEFVGGKCIEENILLAFKKKRKTRRTMKISARLGILQRHIEAGLS